MSYGAAVLPAPPTYLQGWLQLSVILGQTSLETSTGSSQTQELKVAQRRVSVSVAITAAVRSAW